MSTLTQNAGRVVVDGYDLRAELERYAFPDVEIQGARLNRGTASIRVDADPEDEVARAAREEHRRHLFTTTHDELAPVLELGWPVAGHFVAARNGVHLDLYLGVAQKLLDENHPNLLAAVDRVRDLRLAVRREILTDDFHAVRAGLEGVATTSMVAAELAGLAQDAFPRAKGYRVFLGNSGTEANEAAIKLAQRARHVQLLRKYGAETIARLMGQLGIGLVPYFEARRQPGQEPVYADYPYFLFACEGSFHGRTMGALHLTRSRRAHQIGYSKFPWVVHLPYDAAPDALERRLDPRPLPEILAQEGGVRRTLDQGLVPAELAALFIVEGFQGEGGYQLADAAFLRGMRATCSRHGILYVADEVQTFGRTGQAFVHQHHGVAPDVITLAKGAWVGATIAPAELEDVLEPGWHSNTWGGGKVFDNAISHATLTTLRSYRDPLFLGRTYFENERIKGEYLRQRLALLCERHPQTFQDFSGLGCMFGLTVKDRDELVRRAWRRGLKLLGAGVPKDGHGRLRLLFLADVLTREIDAFVDGMDSLAAQLEA